MKNSDLELYQLKQFFWDIFFREIWLISFLTLLSFSLGSWFVYKKEINYKVDAVIRIKNNFMGEKKHFSWIKNSSDYSANIIKSLIQSYKIPEELLTEFKISQDKDTIVKKLLIRPFGAIESRPQSQKNEVTNVDQIDQEWSFESTEKTELKEILKKITSHFFEKENHQIQSELLNQMEDYKREKFALQTKLDTIILQQREVRDSLKSLNLEEDMIAIVSIMNKKIGVAEEQEGKLKLLRSQTEKFRKLLSERLSQDLDLSGFSRSYGDLRNRLVEIQGEKKILTESYDSMHPKIRALNAKIEAIETELKRTEASFREPNNIIAKDGLAFRYAESIRGFEAEAEQILIEIESGKKIIAEQKNRYDLLAMGKSRIQSLEELEKELSTKITDLNKYIEVGSLNLGRDVFAWSFLREPSEPIPYNNAFKNYGFLLSFILAMITTGLVIYTKYFFSGKFLRSSEVAKLLQFPVFGHITLAKKSDGFENVFQGRKTHVAECFRKLRANLTFLEPDARMLTLCSVQKGDGKSFNSMNLAITLSMMGKKVILIDADFKQPRLHRALGVENLLGFIDLLEDCSLEDVVQETPFENLYFIASGISSSNSTDFLHSSRFEQILVQLRQDYEYVVFDTAPLSFSTDPYILGKHSDLTLIVISLDATKVVNAEKHLGELEKLGVGKAGLVVNRVSETELFGQYNYKYYS